ncbi:MAG TPA: isoprenylcysteine carboxylmethyltransferase family protein [Gammaproteobacteria bacterium]|nr:isoprenylcysteine carboxylmethyltransferase family protein [Gammaproteobacteria bacterium]
MSLAIYGRIVSISWIAFVAIWFVAALLKRPGARQYSPVRALLRLVLVVVAALGLRYGDRFPTLTWDHREGAALVGAALCVLGLLFGSWARFTMGSSWGMPMTVGAQTQLVTSGPYGWVRHPIYTGVAAMLIGTALVFPPALLGAVILIPYFVVGAFREERDMRKLFPDVYPEYMLRTKRLVPFLW